LKTRKTVSRWALARRLNQVALRIAAGRPVRIGGVSVRIPDELVLDEEFETGDGETEVEFEFRWPAAAARPTRKRPRAAAAAGLTPPRLPARPAGRG